MHFPMKFLQFAEPGWRASPAAGAGSARAAAGAPPPRPCPRRPAPARPAARRFSWGFRIRTPSVASGEGETCMFRCETALFARKVRRGVGRADVNRTFGAHKCVVGVGSADNGPSKGWPGDLTRNPPRRQSNSPAFRLTRWRFSWTWAAD